MLGTVAAVLALAACANAGSNPVGYTVASPSSVNLVARGAYKGSLSTLQVDGAYTSEAPPFLLQLEGTRYEMGYDYGLLFGIQGKAVFESLLKSILGDSTLAPLEQGALELFLDWQWNDYMASELPEQYHEELRGATAGGAAAGVPGVEVGTLLTRGLVLANLPGSLEDLVYVLEDEAAHPNATSTPSYQALLGAVRSLGEASVAQFARRLVTKGWQPLSCSMIGFWGNRTADGRVYTGRNLDWLANTGINAYKVVTVFRPNDATAHATLGFGGLIGALAGMSAEGITVHEANLEEKPESFRGFPWMLRLRYIMENADDLTSALKLWNSTKNTVGFNHGIGSAKDAKFVVLETNAARSAVFTDMDPREAAATYTDHYNVTQQIGFPLPNAVWRTNNPFDPGMRANFLWSQGPHTNSQERYQIIHDSIVDIERTGARATADDIINVTAVVGQKGDNYYTCGPLPHEGSNVLSVAFDPKSQVIYSAWEANSGDNWVPAACSTFVKLDMSQWF